MCKMARPQLRAELRKSELIKVRVTKATKESIVDASKVAGSKDTTEFILNAVDAAISKLEGNK